MAPEALHQLLHKARDWYISLLFQPPLMEHAEATLSLLDFCWFEQEIFARRAHATTSPSILHQGPEIAEQSSSSGSITAEIARVPSILLRSMSDQLSSQASFLLESSSPNSVLHSPAHLRPIESGEEISEEVLSGFEKQGTGRSANSLQSRGKEDSRRRRRALSKSLSELEFEELKGFMDLGFVFTVEDKDSSLASIIPGLQRLEKNDKQEKREEKDHGETHQKFQDSDQKDSPPPISRPYLSETWEWLDRRKKEERPLLIWDFPALSSETDMKENLRWWAHTVASNVRWRPQ